MKRISKCLFLIASIMVLSIFLMLNAGAVEANIDDYRDEFDFESIVEAIDDEAVEILNQIGIDEISAEKIFSVNAKKIFQVLFEISERSLAAPVRFLVSAIGVLILIALFSSFLNFSQTISVIGSSVLVIFVAVPIVRAVTTAFSVLEALNVFTVAFAGVFSMIASASGNIALGTSYASLAMISNTLFSNLLSGIGQSSINAMCSLGFLSSFDLYKFSEKISSIAKKAYITFLGFIGTFFSGIVTLKGVMGAGIDSLTSRGIRFVVGKSLPFVGGAVSDTYAALVSSLSLIKSTVGIFGIVTVVVTVLPSVLELVGWIFAMSCVISVSELLGSSNCIGSFSIFRDALILLCATTIFSAVIFIVSVGVVIFVKGV